MSFKREGNDTNLLTTLRKRRIKELLSEDIPEDEAKLLCNGRFACTVCRHNPIFDTVNMLSIHRRGKKHLSYTEIFMDKKKELQNLIAIRKHEQFLKDGTTAIKTAKEEFKGILTSRPYDPRVKKPKLTNIEAINTPKDVAKIEISGCSSSWAEVCQSQISGPVIHDYKLKSIFERKIEAPVRIVPYLSRHRPNSKSKAADHVQINLNTASKQANEQNATPPPAINSNVNIYVPETFVSTSETSSLHAIRTSQPTLIPAVKSIDVNKTLKSKSHNNFKSEKLKNLCQKVSPGPKITVQASVADKLRQLQGSGWKRDWDGKWIKDETAEFDSDEEPPDIPYQVSQ